MARRRSCGARRGQSAEVDATTSAPVLEIGFRMAVFRTAGEFTDRVLELVEAIPPGRVMTYGDVAWTFGRPGARAVGTVLRYHGSSVPWWRVLRAGGHPPTGHEAEARAHYEAERTPLLPADTEAGYRVDLTRAAWQPY